MGNYLRCNDFKETDYEKLLINILKVYKDCNITSFPIDCSAILKYYGFHVFGYSRLKEINDELYQICHRCTDDAFTYKQIIAYNDKTNPGRIRFSLMHELGHFFMDSSGLEYPSEKLVDYFASNILAPRAAIFRYRCKTYGEIHDIFDISYAAARRALEDYKSLRISVSDIDQEIWNHFFKSQIRERINIENNNEENTRYSLWSEWHEDMLTYAPHMLTPTLLRC